MAQGFAFDQFAGDEVQIFKAADLGLVAEPQAVLPALLAAIAQSGNAVTDGWMRLLSSSPQIERNSALQSAYVEQQTKLWTSLLAGRNVSVVEDDDRRFAAREWRENPYFNYLRQSYLLAARYLEQIVDSARALIGCRYAALGVLGPDGYISRFPTSGISASEREMIGAPPRGHGLLGVMLRVGPAELTRAQSRRRRA